MAANRPIVRQPVLWAIVALALVAWLVGWLLYRDEVAEIRSERSAELVAVADLKVDQIEAWRHERLGDAEYVSSGPFNRALTERILANPDDPDLREALTERAASLIRLYGYTAVIVATPDGQAFVGAGQRSDRLTAAERQLVDRALQNRKVEFGDIVKSEGAEGLDLSLAAPVMDTAGEPMAAIVFRRDPQDDVLPIVERWPTFSDSAETMLVRREGDHVTYLNRLRHAPDPPLARQVKLTRRGVVSVQALMTGQVGTIDGHDYRGAHVLAEVRRVPGTSWLMIAKIDQDEMLAEARYKLRAKGVVILLAALLSLAGVFAYFGRRQQAYYRELYATERERREAEQETRATLYSIGDAVITTDGDARVRRMNPVAEQLSGWTEADAAGRPLHDVFRIISEDTRRAVESPAVRVLRDGVIVGLANHTLLLTRDGREVPIADSAAPIRDALGDEPSGVVLVFRDQTRERDVQRVIQRDAQRLRVLFDQTLDGIVLIEDGRVAECNAAYARMLGRTLEETRQCCVWDWDVQLDTEEKFFAVYPASAPRLGRFEGRFRRKDGSVFDVEVTHTPVEWDGQSMAFCVVRDITERKRMEEAMLLSEQQFREFAEFVPLLTWIAGPDGMLSYCNRRWFDYTGLTPEQAAGTGWLRTVHPADIERLRSAWSVSVLEGKPYAEECRLRRQDGVFRWHLARSLPVPDEQGAIRRWIGYAVDIQDLKSSRELVEHELADRTRDLVAARDQATAANRVKDIFLATMSHELRTPLNSIIGFSGLLLDGLTGQLNEEQRRQVDIVHKSGQHLLGLISDVLDISKIETGRLPLDMVPVRLRQLVEDQLQSVETQAAERGLVIDAELPEASVSVIGDAKRVRQVLNNLLSNAIKYSDQGRIGVRAAVQGEFVRVEVEDQGIGIPAEELPKIFQPFHRVPLPKGTVREGTGLGLAVSKRLVVAMGGEIGVASEPGRGSHFWFTLRLA